MAVDLDRIHHVGIVVEDLEASTAWYAEQLGFEPRGGFAYPGARVAFVGRGDLRLELFQVEGAARIAAERQSPATNIKIGGINHFAIAVDDLERVVADLKLKGVEIVREPADVGDGLGDRFAFVRDNERMLVELFEPRGVG